MLEDMFKDTRLVYFLIYLINSCIYLGIDTDWFKNKNFNWLSVYPII